MTMLIFFYVCAHMSLLVARRRRTSPWEAVAMGSEADRETLRKEIIPSAPSACTGEGRTTHDRGHGVVGVEGDA